MLVTLVMLATCFGLLFGIGILFGIVGLLLKFGGKVLGACATILLPIGVIWLGFKIVFAVVPLLFKPYCSTFFQQNNGEDVEEFLKFFFTPIE